jgi:hypothetical protein
MWVEIDAVEHVSAGPPDPRLGDEAASFESGRVMAQAVDDEIKEFLRERE